MIIGVTDNRVNEEKYLLYEAWIREGLPKAKIARLVPGDGAASRAVKYDALVLTGGGDIDPRIYGGNAVHGSLYEVSPERDAFEAAHVRRALDVGIPVLGICRGMQLVNVALGGTLITDLEEAGHPPHRTVNGVKCRHGVRLEPGSVMAGRLGIDSGWVISSHHQAVDRPGEGLAVTARSDDGVIEALELTGTGGELRILCVQWHPERMSGNDAPLSAGVRSMFFNSLALK